MPVTYTKDRVEGKSLSLIPPFHAKDPVNLALGLLAKSKIHKYWTVLDILRLIFPPIEHNQCVFAYSNHFLIGFCTWGFFSKEVAQDFASGRRPLAPQDWESGENLWIVDAIAPYGQVQQLGRKVHTLLKERFPSTPSIQAIRYYPNRHRRTITCRLQHFSQYKSHDE